MNLTVGADRLCTNAVASPVVSICTKKINKRVKLTSRDCDFLESPPVILYGKQQKTPGNCNCTNTLLFLFLLFVLSIADQLLAINVMHIHMHESRISL